MIKYCLYLFIFITMIYNGFFIHAYAKDPLFIENDHYGDWTLTKKYNQIWLSNLKDANNFTIRIQPYDYSLRIIVTLHKINNDASSLELDIGDFTTELTKEKDNIYKTILEPVNIVQFVNELKKQKTLNLTLNDQSDFNVSLQGINDAITEMESFTKDHYIILPQPFSIKVDEFTTMDIPDAVPSNLYPLFRQQAYLDQKCKSEHNSQKETCMKNYKTVVGLLKENNICKIEKRQPSLAYNLPSIKSYQWVHCSSITKEK